MMYREVYKEMVTGGIAVRLDNKVCMTKEGETVKRTMPIDLVLQRETRLCAQIGCCLWMRLTRIRCRLKMETCAVRSFVQSITASAHTSSNKGLTLHRSWIYWCNGHTIFVYYYIRSKGAQCNLGTRPWSDSRMDWRRWQSERECGTRETKKNSDLFYVLPRCSWLGGLDPHGTTLPSSG